MARVLVTSLKKKFKKLETPLRRKSGKLIRLIVKNFPSKTRFGNGPIFIEVFLVDNEKMKKLNRKWRKVNKVADVLTFITPKDFYEGPRKNSLSAEVYLAPDYVKAKRARLERFLVHGLLHVFGYDHKKKRDMIEMEKEEEFLIKIITNNK